MHPARPAAFADYRTEPKSKYEIWQVLGWPYETSAAMARLVFSGLLARLPRMRLITHHCGGMIPYFAGRAETLWAQLGSRSADEDYAEVLKRLAKPPIEYFRMFYGDTALFGAREAMESGLAFFGADRVLFGTDMPFDPEKGHGFIRDTIAAVDTMRATAEERAKIYEGNARRLLRLRG